MSLFSYMTTTQIKFKLAELEETIRDQEEIIKEMRAVLQYRADKEKELKDKNEWFFLATAAASHFTNSDKIKGEVESHPFVPYVLQDKQTGELISDTLHSQNIVYRFLKEGVRVYYSVNKGTIRFFLKKTQ